MHLLQIKEYGPPQPLITQLGELTGMSISRSEKAVVVAGERLRVQHRLRSSPFQIVDGLVRVEDVAGVVSLTASVDLEITPKFASDQINWANDVLFLSLFTRYGRIDPLRPVAAGTGQAHTLADIAARTLLDLIRQNTRTPLKQRQRVAFQSFEPEGDIDPEGLLVLEDEGWVQSDYRLTLDNPYASTLAAACKFLVPHVRSVGLRSLLNDQITRLGRQSSPPVQKAKRMPPRLSRWQSAVDLASALISGGSLSPLQGRLSTVGFTISTWRTWESLIERALVLSIGGSAVTLQPPIRLGSSSRKFQVNDVIVQPDALVELGGERVVIDAKYKGRLDKPLSGVSAADRYEIMGFMMAAAASKAVLIYPATSEGLGCGSHNCFETLDLPTGQILAYAIGVAGISRPGGLAAFAAGAREIVTYAASSGASQERHGCRRQTSLLENHSAPLE